MVYGTTDCAYYFKPLAGAPSRESAIEASVQTVEDLVETLEGVRNGRKMESEGVVNPPGQPEPPAKPGGGRQTGGGGETPTRRVVRPGVDAGGVGPPGEGGAGDGGGTGSDTGAGGTDVAGVAAETDNAVSDDTPGRGGLPDEGGGAGEGGGDDVRRSGPTDRNRVDEYGAGGGDAVRGDSVAVDRKAEVKQASREALTYATYSSTAATMPADAQEHVTLLDETVAMAEIPLPEATYVPNLPAELIETGGLSKAQLETVIYAGQSHETTITGEDEGTYRSGFFLGVGYLG